MILTSWTTQSCLINNLYELISVYLFKTEGLFQQISSIALHTRTLMTFALWSLMGGKKKKERKEKKQNITDKPAPHPQPPMYNLFDPLQNISWNWQSSFLMYV